MRSVVIAVAILFGISSAPLGNPVFGTRADYPAGSNPLTVCAGDFDGDCKIDLADLSRLVNYLTGGGAQMMPGCEGPGVFSADKANSADLRE